MPGAAARPGTSRLAVVANLIIALNVRHEPSPFRCQARRECVANFML
jgi:hypothetical protein